MVNIFLVFITKIQIYVSENIGLTILVPNGSLVSGFPICVDACTDGDRISGDFNPGVQSRGTPITAEVVQGGYMDINVMWRGVQGHVVSVSWSKTWGWGLSNRDTQPAIQEGLIPQ